MSDLVPLVNRFRSQGWKYDQIKEKLVKMGNAPEEAEAAIGKYVLETCGIAPSQQSKA